MKGGRLAEKVSGEEKIERSAISSLLKEEGRAILGVPLLLEIRRSSVILVRATSRGK